MLFTKYNTPWTLRTSSMGTKAVLVENLTDVDLHGLRGKSSNLSKILCVHHLKICLILLLVLPNLTKYEGITGSR